MALRQRLDYNPAGKRVRVYRNLHAQAWSILAMEGPYRGRVVAHADEVTLDSAKFVVLPAGRKRVLTEKRKNVHAFVDGIMREKSTSHFGLLRVTYNPFLSGRFRLFHDWRPVETVEVFLADENGKIWGVGF